MCALVATATVLLCASSASAASLGALSQLPLPSGCLSTDITQNPGCTSNSSLDRPTSLALSPDGKNLYLTQYGTGTSLGAVLIFARDPATGKVTPLAGTAGCIHEGPASSSCSAGRELNHPTDVKVSRDGRFIYVTSDRSPNAPFQGAGGGVAILTRNASTGALTQTGTNASTGAADSNPAVAHLGCIDEARFSSNADSCATARGLTGARGLVLSPDSAQSHLYVVGNVQSSAPPFGSGFMAILNRSASGGDLSQGNTASSCLQQFGASETPACFGDPSTDPAGNKVRGLNGATRVAISPDGASLYVAAQVVLTVPFASLQAAALGVYRIPDQGSGFVKQAPVEQGCIAADPAASSIAGYGTCSVGRGLAGLADVAVSPDGANVYTAAESGNFYLLNITGSGGVGVFSRDSTTSELTQLDGHGGCVNSTGAQGCGVARAANNAQGIAVSPDGRNVYSTSGFWHRWSGITSSNGVPSSYPFGDDAVIAFSRDGGTGALRQLSSTDGCAKDPASDTGDNTLPECSVGRGLLGAGPVVVSPDDEHVYAASYIGSRGGQKGPEARVSAVAGFDRNDLAPTCVSFSILAVQGHTTPVQLRCTDPDGNPLTYSIVSNPAHGTLSGLDPVTGKVNYTPNAGYSGGDSFTYQAADNFGQRSDAVSNVATVTLTIPAVTPTPTPTPQPGRAPRISIKGLRGTRGSCAKSTFVFTVAIPAGTGSHLTVYLDGRKLKGKNARRLHVRIKGAKLRPGRHHLRIVARSNGRTSTRRVAFNVCSRRRHHRQGQQGTAPRFTG